MKFVAWMVIISCAMMPFCGCQTIGNTFKSLFGDSAQKTDVAGRDAETKAQYVPPGDPLIVPGLTLRVGVTASGAEAVAEAMKEVSLNGDILMPLIGAVKCEGLTVLQLQDKLQTAYKEFYQDPQVTVGFAYVENQGMKSPWGTVLLMGEVAHQGPVNMPSTRELTVTRALMLAGNVTAVANKHEVRVTRRDADGKLERFIVDIDKIGKEGRSDLDIALKPGDVIWVPESWY